VRTLPLALLHVGCELQASSFPARRKAWIILEAATSGKRMGRLHRRVLRPKR